MAQLDSPFELANPSARLSCGAEWAIGTCGIKLKLDRTEPHPNDSCTTVGAGPRSSGGHVGHAPLPTPVMHTWCRWRRSSESPSTPQPDSGRALAARLSAGAVLARPADRRDTLACVSTLSELQTPLIVIDAPTLTRNITRMAEAAAAGRKQLRPHGKTHKSGWVARQQIAAGAIGLTCAKPGEAEVFAAEGVDDIRIAYPISPTYATRVLSLMDGVRLSTVIDDLEVAQAWSSAMEAAGRRLEVLVKIDVGTHRCGVDPSQRDALAFIEAVSQMPGLDLRGLLSHAGHAYGGRSVEEIARVAREEAALMAELVEGCTARGVALDEISVGSTPTARVSATLDGITELRPGNYVFHDRTQVGLGVVGWPDCALRIHASVVSRGAADRLVLDAGSKVLSSDGARGFGETPGYGVVLGPDGEPDPGLVIERLSEEHAVVGVTGETRLRIGDRVTVVPNHACVVANLANTYVVADGDEVLEKLKVDARGCVN